MGKEVNKIKKIIKEEVNDFQNDYKKIVQTFADMLQVKVDEYYKINYDNIYKNNMVDQVKIKPGKKYIKIDVGSSGKFMYDIVDGNLYYIKGYGTIDRKKNFGNLASIVEKDFKFDGYSIVPKDANYSSQYGYASKIGESKKLKIIRRVVKEEVIKVFESKQRYCGVYKTIDNNWYIDLAFDEYGGHDNSITYGPFNSEENAKKYIFDNFSNPGNINVNNRGTVSVPTKSPNGSDVKKPISQNTLKWNGISDTISK